MNRGTSGEMSRNARSESIGDTVQEDFMRVL